MLKKGICSVDTQILENCQKNDHFQVLGQVHASVKQKFFVDNKIFSRHFVNREDTRICLACWHNSRELHAQQTGSCRGREVEGVTTYLH